MPEEELVLRVGHAARQAAGLEEQARNVLARDRERLEDRIARARRFYNGNVRDLGNRIEVFPSNLVAGAFGFQKREFFEIEDSTARANPKVQL